MTPPRSARRYARPFSDHRAPRTSCSTLDPERRSPRYPQHPRRYITKGLSAESSEPLGFSLHRVAFIQTAMSYPGFVKRRCSKLMHYHVLGVFQSSTFCKQGGWSRSSPRLHARRDLGSWNAVTMASCSEGFAGSHRAHAQGEGRPLAVPRLMTLLRSRRGGVSTAQRSPRT